MGVTEALFEAFDVVWVKALGLELNGFGDFTGEFLEKLCGGDMAGLTAAHTVGDSEDEIIVVEAERALIGQWITAFGTGGANDYAIVVFRLAFA